jgi:hypothetical protein
MAELVYPTNEFLHFHNDLANVVEHADGYVSIDWKPAPMRTAHLRDVYNQALELLTYTRYGRILTDHQLMAPILPHDAEWLVQDWVPRAVQVGSYRRCAVVQSHELLNRQTTQRIVGQLTNTPLTIHYFHDRAAAAAWLLTKTSP